MKNPSLRLGTGARLVVRPASDNTRLATATLSHPQAMNCVPALVAAAIICGVLGGISLLVPPFIDNDSGYGFLAWHGTLLGATNSVISPNPANISQDTAELLTAFSPGQYLIPGVISLLGVPLGIAMSLTVTLSMLVSLIGWVMVVREFAPRTSSALLVTILIGSFRYSTAAFGIYHGGEILLQAATPWLILMACRVPEMDAAPAALLTAGAVFFAFLAKLTGIIVVAAALVASGLVVLSVGRRITHGMIGGALGALIAVAILYITFLSKGWTAVSATAWSLPFGSIAFAVLVPWVAGVSWSDLMTSMFFTSRYTFSMPMSYLVVIIPPAFLVGSLVFYWRPQTANEKKLKVFSLWLYSVMSMGFIILFIHGAVIDLVERHFRSVGTLLFVCALISALSAGTPRWARGGFLALCVVTALYGLASFSHRAWITSNGQSLDRMSWTNQNMFDLAAIDFIRKAYVRERRDALFVLPTYQLAVTLPTDARVLAIDLNWETESVIAGFRYSGRVPGHIFVLMPNTIFDGKNGILDMAKGPTLLSAFKDYAPNAWTRKTFANMSVFFQ